jgi:hypothetical protein
MHLFLSAFEDVPDHSSPLQVDRGGDGLAAQSAFVATLV